MLDAKQRRPLVKLTGFRKRLSRPMDSHAWVALGVGVLATILTTNFGVAGYLYYQWAREKAHQSVSSSPLEPPGLLLRKADGLLVRRETEQALLTYRRALARDPRSLPAQLGVARGELAAGREDVAAREYERALRLEPANKTALLQLAKIYSHRKATWSFSEACYRRYLELEPGDVHAQLELARIVVWQGKSKEATEIFSRPGLSPLMTQEDRRNYVFALIKSGKPQQAEQALKELLAEGRLDFDLKLQLAGFYASRQEWDTALPLYHSLLRDRPEDPQLNLTYGVGLLAVKDYEEALAPLAIASRAMPSNTEAGLSYAHALRGAKDAKGAVREFARILPLFEGDAQVIREYADSLLDKRDYRGAGKYYKEAYGLGLRDTRLLVSLSGALRGNHQPREALPYLEQAYRQEPTDRLAFELAKLLHELGRNDEALRLVQKIKPTGRTPN